MKIGVTGANGFVGGHLLAALNAAGDDVRALVRSPDRMDASLCTDVAPIPTLVRDTDPESLRTALAGLDAVVHLAARVHVMNATLDDEAFTRVNVDGSAHLFTACAAAGIKRFVYMSSVKAAGERSTDRPLSADDAPAPEDAYGRSKLAAENRLRELARDSACELVILRPAFVYGWPPAGNFKTVISAVLKGLPLPLGGIDNRRDMTYVGNLADAVRAAVHAPNLLTTPYFIADAEAVSTPTLFRRVGEAFARPARLFYVPVWLLRLIGLLSGRSATIARITENFVVDTGPFRRDARWQPPYKMSEGLGAVAGAWRDAENRAGPV